MIAPRGVEGKTHSALGHLQFISGALAKKAVSAEWLVSDR
jgi:hypothetical protein